MGIDLSGALDALDVESVVAGAPVPDFSGIWGDLAAGDLHTPDQLEASLGAAKGYADGYTAWLGQNGESLKPGDPAFAEMLA